MIKTNLISVIEKIRIQKNIKIKDLTNGIISSRNYSRYLSNEIELSFEMLIKLLERLDMPLFLFANYSKNLAIIENIEEMHFFDTVLSGDYQKAYDLYYKEHIENKELKTFYAYKLIPCSIYLMKYKLNKTTLVNAKNEMKKIVDIDSIEKNNVIFLEDIGAMRLYSEICDDADKRRIKDIIYGVIVKKNKEILTTLLEVTYISAYYTFLNSATKITNITKEDHDMIEEVIIEFLKYHKKGQIAYEDTQILKLIHDYIKNEKINNSLITYQYILSILSNEGHAYHKTLLANLTSEDFNNFIEVLSNESINQERMYERLIKDGIN